MKRKVPSRSRRPAPKAPKAPPVVLSSRFIVRQLSTEHKKFLGEYARTPGNSKSVSGAVDQILSRYPLSVARLEELQREHDGLRDLVDQYVRAMARSKEAEDRASKAFDDVVAFVATLPVNYARQLSLLDQPGVYDEDDD